MANKEKSFVVSLANGVQFEVTGTIQKMMDGCVLFHDADGEVVSIVPIASLAGVFEVGKSKVLTPAKAKRASE